MIWTPDTIEIEPAVELQDWRVFRVEDSNDHFVGFNIILLEGRVSSPIRHFDKEKRVGITRSGRAYILKGKSGFCQEGEYVFNRWLQWNRFNPETIQNVTNEYE